MPRKLSYVEDSASDVISREKPRAEAVADELRKAILSGELAPGERIKQDAVAKRFGVSRLPVREALKDLAADHLVTLERDVGARVTLLDPRELLEIYRLREAIEPMMVAASAPLITDAELAEARQLNAAGEACMNAGETQDYLLNDRAFHTCLLEAARMPRALAMVRNLWQTAERYRRIYTILPHRLEISVVEHRMLVEALERRASEDAAELYRIHVRRTRLTLAEHPELFPEQRGR